MTEKKNIKILAFCENPMLSSGFANQAKEILLSLYEDGYDIECACWSYSGINPIMKEEFPIKVRPLSIRTYFGAELVNHYIEELKPNVVFYYGDPYAITLAGTTLLENAKARNIPIVAYLAIDSESHTELEADIIRDIDYPVVFTDWAKKQLEQEFFNLRFNNKLNVIYHGHYKPIEVTQELRQEIINKISINRNIKLENKKILISIFRNCKRKAPDKLIEAIKLLRQKRNDFICILHTKPKSNDGDALDLEQLIQKEKLENTILISDPANYKTNISRNIVNSLYAIADLNIVTSTAEGWCLPVTESALYGVPSIGTDYSSLSQLLDNDRGYKINYLDYYLTENYNHKHVLINTSELADKIDYILDNLDEAKSKALNMKNWVLENCMWDKIKKDWQKLFDRVLSKE